MRSFLLRECLHFSFYRYFRLMGEIDIFALGQIRYIPAYGADSI